MSHQVLPLSHEVCHWYEATRVAATEKATLVPSTPATLSGCEVISYWFAYTASNSYTAVQVVLDVVVTLEVAVSSTLVPSVVVHSRPFSVSATMPFWMPQIVGG